MPISSNVPTRVHIPKSTNPFSAEADGHGHIDPSRADRRPDDSRAAKRRVSLGQVVVSEPVDKDFDDYHKFNLYVILLHLVGERLYATSIEHC